LYSFLKKKGRKKERGKGIRKRMEKEKKK